MIQTRYGLPLIVAVALHAALFLWIPRNEIGFITPAVPAVVLRPIPTEIIEAMRPPPSAAARAAPRPKPQKEAPSLDEIVPVRVTHADFLTPVVSRPPTQFTSMDKVPEGYIPGVIGGVIGGGFIGGEGAAPLASLDRTPRARAQPAPQYPMAMRSSGVEGTVMVEFTVDTQGQVISATVLNATNREFEEATIRAVMKWRFEPGRRNGRIVPFRMAVPLEFRLGDS